MSEPLAEAKQAAEKEIHNVASEGIEGCEPVGYYVQQAIDTATEGLRFELEQAWSIANEQKQAIDTATAKLREERNGDWLDKMGTCKVCDGEIPNGHTENCDIWKMEQEITKLREELERVNREWQITKDSWKIEHSLREMAEEQLAHQQPSAPTADVEKIAREFAREWYGDDQGSFQEQLYKDALRYFAQGRAPLVEALEAIRATGGSSVCVRAWHRCLEIADAALTGTGEKEEINV